MPRDRSFSALEIPISPSKVCWQRLIPCCLSNTKSYLRHLCRRDQIAGHLQPGPLREVAEQAGLLREVKNYFDTRAAAAISCKARPLFYYQLALYPSEEFRNLILISTVPNGSSESTNTVTCPGSPSPLVTILRTVIHSISRRVMPSTILSAADTAMAVSIPALLQRPNSPKNTKDNWGTL